MNLHEASRRSTKLHPEKRNERKTATFDVAGVFNAEAVNTTFPLHEYFPLGGFQLERRARATAVGLDRRRRPRIWRGMRMRQPTGKGTLAVTITRSNYFPFNLTYIFHFWRCFIISFTVNSCGLPLVLLNTRSVFQNFTFLLFKIN